MFLKFRYRLGYESLCAEVSDSISWRRFCRIGLDGRVPHPTTLMKLASRCGEGAVAIPRQATTSAARKAVEHGRGFRKLVKWRTGCDGRISYLKRGYGWDRTCLDRRQGAAIWWGTGYSPTTWSRSRA